MSQTNLIWEMSVNSLTITEPWINATVTLEKNMYIVKVPFLSNKLYRKRLCVQVTSDFLGTAIINDLIEATHKKTHNQK